jgi:hypothetical protein
MNPDITKVKELTVQIHRLLAGHGPEIQGTVLSDLLATWLAGHIDLTSREDTKAVRERLLAMHIGMVEKLLPVNAKGMGQPW